jgi:CheY-like chemotaxis protein
VVDDSAEVRRLLARAIAEEGCRVLDAPSAAHALALANDVPPDLLVTDVAMPGMRGPELAATLRRERPTLRVVYVTAYAEEELDLAGDSLSSVLWKPFPMKELRRAVRRALESEIAARNL